ncbi:UVI-1 protein [Microdochium trichocladiopsis]|uniref:UVI-1 protein n=1 Tax=Microdochium trichocladiopsis TaxID=1682393 RepID=A0A9P8YM76_9PEZI|nr:UVI-1 protein [Microdochium trichocladiopsis]KAH7041604.1 UVI-1 protein [Microdochium trichocladiopsis]
MRFSVLSTAVAALAACSDAVQAALTPAQMVSNIQVITQKSMALQGPAQQISIINGPLIVIGQGPFPALIVGFTDIVSTATTAITQMQGSEPVTAAADATAIFEAFREFVRVHQALLNILIGKAGLFNTIPFVGQPIAAVLRQVEGVVDTIAFSLIDLVESRAQDLQREANSLGMTITTAIDSYDGLSLSKAKRGLVRSNSFRAVRA